MYRSARILVLVVALAMAGCAETAPPVFVSKEDHFKVLFGSRPKFTEKAGAIRSVSYSVETADGARTVTITDLPIPDDAPADRVLASAKDELIRAAGGKQLTDESVSLAGKYPGREFAARFGTPPGLVRARIFLVGRRLYQVMAVGTEEFANSAASTAFLSSFMVTSE